MSRYLVILLSLYSATSALSIPFIHDAEQTVFNTHAPADLPHPNPTHSFWTHTPGANPLAGVGSTGALTDEADVCIIGAGITGVSAAYHFANTVGESAFPIPEGETKLRVVVLEARDFCEFRCHGWRNGGNLTPYEFLEFRKVEAQFGREAAMRYYAMEHYTSTEMARIARAGGWADAVDLVEGGHMDVMLTEARLAEVRADFDAAIAAGKRVNVTWLSREDMQSAYGTYNWGVRSPGYNVWSLKFVTQLFRQANATARSALDLRLHTRTPVTSITPLSASVSARKWALDTPRGAVKCTYVVHATNAYASHLLPHMAGPGPAGIVPVRGQVLAMRANASLAALSTTSWVGNAGYWFPRPVHSADEAPLVILGGARTAAGAPFEVGVTDDGEINPSVGRVLRAFLPALFPGMYEPGREPEAEWTGIMGYTTLNIPFVGPVLDVARPDAHAGQFIAAGYAGHGMPRAFACAEAVVGMIAAERAGRVWEAPAWFPAPFLTGVRDAPQE
ncbi:FAD dependent oxidoreductase [Mycena rosella]|uniref:FAD dependent oxidoreductase n=1 Tax=Mycena rosella TaxID=1033263 RepID=A0AAD7DPN6_MYCRO|nr:FAD dependent oxidoreductase [Mycena rosella]